MPIGFLTAAERDRLNCFPALIPDEDLRAFFLLSAADQQAINRQRDAHTRLGFALQLCALRYLGFAPLFPPLSSLPFSLRRCRPSASSFAPSPGARWAPRGLLLCGMPFRPSPPRARWRRGVLAPRFPPASTSGVSCRVHDAAHTSSPPGARARSGPFAPDNACGAVALASTSVATTTRQPTVSTSASWPSAPVLVYRLPPEVTEPRRRQCCGPVQGVFFLGSPLVSARSIASSSARNCSSTSCDV